MSSLGRERPSIVTAWRDSRSLPLRSSRPLCLNRRSFEALVSSLYAVHCEIFDGVSHDEFSHYVVGSRADETRIQVSYGEEGDVAGYVAAHSFRRKLRGELVAA